VDDARKQREKKAANNKGFTSADAAAVAWTQIYGEYSIKNNREVSSFIYSYMEGDNLLCTFTEGREYNDPKYRQRHSPANRKGTEKFLPKDAKIVAHIHSHGVFTQGWQNDFSNHEVVKVKGWYLDSDLIVDNPDIDFYLANPRGQLRVWRHQNTNLGS
jgi:hypothetical protein